MASNGKDYLGEEAAARTTRARHDVISASVGGIAVLVVVFLQTLFSAAATKFIDKLSVVAGGWEAWLIAAVFGVIIFGVVKVAIFFVACRRQAVFGSKRLAGVIARHYKRICLRHPYLLGLIICLSLVNGLLLFGWHGASNFPLIFFALSSSAFGLLTILFYNAILGFARENQRSLSHVVLKLIHPSVMWQTAQTSNPNILISERLLSLTKKDIICIAAVHFSHLMRHPDGLTKIRDNNPGAAIYFMPQFPYSWHVLERAAELEYPYRTGYLGPLIRACYNARTHLIAKVRLRHRPAEFRLSLWAKFGGDKDDAANQGEPHTLPIEALRTQIESGGFFTQQYIHGQEGYQSPYLSIDLEEWWGAFSYLINWFFSEWRTATSPMQISELCADEQYMRRVAKGIGLRTRKINRLVDAGELPQFLQHEEILTMLYRGIETGSL